MENYSKKIYSYGMISAQKLEEFMAKGDIFLLDVHVPEQQHILQTSEYIPYNELSDHAGRLPFDKVKELVIYCRSELMSRTAAEKLIEMGYTNVSVLKGGIKAWNKYNEKKL